MEGSASSIYLMRSIPLLDCLIWPVEDGISYRLYSWPGNYLLSLSRGF